MNLEELKTKIVDACEKAKEKGYKILPGTTFIKNQQVCLIGAGMVMSGKEWPTWFDGIAYLGINDDDSNMIATGYDNHYPDRSKYTDNELWQLGNKLRERYS